LGTYEITEFRPSLSKEKWKEFGSLFRQKITLIVLIIALFFTPSLLLQKMIKINLNSKNPNYKRAIFVSNLYNHIYPKSSKILDMSVYEKYMTEDYEASLSDYKTIFKISGKNFDKKDITRFANLLYMEKKVYGSANAIDTFNEYSTKKRLSILDETQLLWIKSLFSIKNNISETVIIDYDNLLTSLPENDSKNRFYISCDKAYMLYLMGEYQSALKLYDALIKFASSNKKKYSKELVSLYAERGFTKKNLGDEQGAKLDFNESKIDSESINAYEPSNSRQGFIVEKF
jgi:tetratricopeptide (TPR) repeat protein